MLAARLIAGVFATLLLSVAPAHAQAAKALPTMGREPSCEVDGRGPGLYMTVGLAIVNGKRQFRSAEAIAAIVARNDPATILGWYAVDDSGDDWVFMRKEAVTRNDVIAWLGSSAPHSAMFMVPVGTQARLPQSLVLSACDASSRVYAPK